MSVKDYLGWVSWCGKIYLTCRQYHPAAYRFRIKRRKQDEPWHPSSLCFLTVGATWSADTNSYHYVFPIRMGFTFKLRARITPFFLSWCILIPATEKIRQTPRIHCHELLPPSTYGNPAVLILQKTKLHALNSDPHCHLISVSSLPILLLFLSLCF